MSQNQSMRSNYNRIYQWHRRKGLIHVWWLGFTMIEFLVIVAVLGIVASLSGPSFSAMLDSAALAQSATEVQTALKETQRQAIRKHQVCETIMTQRGGSSFSHNHSGRHSALNRSISGTCLTSGNRELANHVDLVSNLKSLPNSTNSVKVTYHSLGSAEFSILSALPTSSLAESDTTGKIITYIPNNPRLKKRCVEISSTLGLTRVGEYEGGLLPEDITGHGVCTALDWKHQ